MAFEPRATSFSTANAQILAQASAVAYDTPERCAKWAKVSGFTGAFDFFDHQHTQGFVTESGEAIIVAFRGTQPNRPMDWFADFRATCDPWDHRNAGRVHSGFYSALRKVWGVTLANGEILPRRLVNRGNKTIWITGHSLGGALAVLCAAQALFVSRVPVQGVYTFGQPRVGTKDFADAVNAMLGSGIVRFVNDRDIVPRVPLFSMGFCHYGGQRFFDHAGESSVADSAVETVKDAFTLAKSALNLAVLGQVAGLVTDGFKHIVSGGFTDEQERAFREHAVEILKGGVEKIDDHSMHKHYLVRLKTSLPV
jgi:triacylglycerol lipase